MVAAIQKWGWTMPVLVDEGGELIAGALRIRAAISMGLTEIPVIVGGAGARKKSGPIDWPTISSRPGRAGTWSGSAKKFEI
jgi:hypothetical protein